MEILLSILVVVAIGVVASMFMTKQLNDDRKEITANSVSKGRFKIEAIQQYLTPIEYGAMAVSTAQKDFESFINVLNQYSESNNNPQSLIYLITNKYQGIVKLNYLALHCASYIGHARFVAFAPNSTIEFIGRGMLSALAEQRDADINQDLLSYFEILSGLSIGYHEYILKSPAVEVTDFDENPAVKMAVEEIIEKIANTEEARVCFNPTEIIYVSAMLCADIKANLKALSIDAKLTFEPS